MAFGYRVANLRLTSGERLPLLLDSTTGVPLWSPTLFILTELRAKNRASATMLQATRAIMVDMAPLAQAFAGVIADGSLGAKDPSKRIIDLRIDRSGDPMGECGEHGFCSFAAPIACYTCRSFEAWLDGPHEAVLDHLLKRRERLKATSDNRMASVNDRTILAVAAVIQRCAELKAEGEGEVVG